MTETYQIKGSKLTRDDLLALETDILRSLIHERTHHTVESFLYQILKGKRKPPKGYGDEVRILLEIWKERKLPEYLRMDTHIAMGWPDEATIKAARMPLKDAMITSPGKGAR